MRVCFEEPLERAKTLLGERVYVKMREARELEGVLGGFDNHLNVLLTDVTERATEGAQTRRFDTLFVRGDTMVFFSLSDTPAKRVSC
ncbi:MAG: U6 snRNP-associated protein Lsm3 [Amphiamblys sp. WSBS2006]|nr:MAG: U6 snRNP-associated protein Lsm3 [Amphiamblys sp. WSBS2006]